MEDYDPSIDYRQLHLEWIKKNRWFRPKSGVADWADSYYDQMSAMYRDTYKLHTTAYLLLRDDYKHSKVSADINTVVGRMFGDTPINTNPYYFVTYNWTTTNFDPKKAVVGVNRLFEKSWVDKALAVFEYHGIENNHPHLHIVIQVNKYKTIGKFREKMFEASLASGILKNFIDIKPGRPEHWDYTSGDKSLDKKECLEKDIIWRNENSLEHIYKK